jgi:hypothetical protein
VLRAEQTTQPAADFSFDDLHDSYIRGKVQAMQSILVELGLNSIKEGLRSAEIVFPGRQAGISLVG